MTIPALNLAGCPVESDTTWNHFEQFREAFETSGLPEIVSTAGLSLFGPSSSHDHRDPKSEFQRALRGLGVAHPVAPSPQAKGEIERRFGTFQCRLVTLLAHARAQTWDQAADVLQMEIARQNRTVSRRVNHDHTIDFDGHNYEIAPTLSKTVTLVYQPRRLFWILVHPPEDVWSAILPCKDLSGFEPSPTAAKITLAQIGGGVSLPPAPLEPIRVGR